MQRLITSFSGEFEFLSNFYPVDLLVDGIAYHSSEAAFQAAKTPDISQKIRISDAKTPGEAKRLGRQVTMRRDWEEKKDKVMFDLLRKKFARGTDLARRLDATGDAVLVEGNKWHDQYWGVCTCPKCGGVGRNVLGQLLMTVRAENRIPQISHDMTDSWLYGNPDSES